MNDFVWPTRAAGTRVQAAHNATLGTEADPHASLLAANLLWQMEHHRQLVKISRGVWIVGLLLLATLSSIADKLPQQ